MHKGEKLEVITRAQARANDDRTRVLAGEIVTYGQDQDILEVELEKCTDRLNAAVYVVPKVKNNSLGFGLC